ncbi:MAG: T9SS type A sorting domain-containing protein [Bacteroidaceae bacterium]|nr:T9SS type A sorting domain-containing protein [Bacteroidaceae bacterium]
MNLTHHTHAHTMGWLRGMACALLLASQITLAQTRLWITGSAVPGGTQPLEKFPISGSSGNCFKFHGTLLPGDLYIVTTEEASAARYYYAPKLVDSNIVNDGIAWTKTRKEEGSAWTVLFEADNYRFTINPTTSGTVKGELFSWWYEAWVVGGCTSDRQGEKEGEPGKWQVSAGKQMEQSPDNPYEWFFMGELKEYTYNVEPKRFKINGQYGWSPKVLHPFKQDTPILTATQVCYGGDDNKWVIGDDGYYLIIANVFTETISAEYSDEPLGFEPIVDYERQEADIRVSGRQVIITGQELLTASLFASDGKRMDMQSGTQVRLTATRPGAYIVHTVSGDKKVSKKIVIE